ncbi:hypothetical protein CK203_106745 [Vitis vinifera]|uniref:Uncharacterized protein n=1 Tax=Vitis vinifera TaxID=29760 RepID=A0A438FGC3_VITVI|nr:hypothetical protein CK203_106745 [Vitis vinifera]
MAASTRRHNTMADALSRKEVIAYITVLLEVISNFNERIKQMDKTERKKVVELLQPLPILEKPWERISMDFIIEFPKRSSATGMSLFELAIGVQPRMLLEVAKQKIGGNSLQPTNWLGLGKRCTMCTPEGHHAFARRTPRAGQMSTTRHTDDTQARTHELHNMCGVHSVAATTWVGCSLPPPCVGTKAPKNLYNEPVEEAMGSMPWLNGH